MARLDARREGREGRAGSACCVCATLRGSAQGRAYSIRRRRGFLLQGRGAGDRQRDPTEADRICALLGASWKVFDAAVAKAPAELRKGPRGGGRDRDKIADHVIDAESAYTPKLGLKLKPPGRTDAPGVRAWRKTIIDAIGGSAGGPQAGEKRWPPRYVARRMAWHLLDHAWEIEDRSA